MNEQIARRKYLKQLSAAAMATMSMGAPQLLAAPGGHKIVHPKPKADACILLWMAGGMAAPDTFDPKRYSPFESGTKVSDVLSTFPAIDTVVDDVKLTALSARSRTHSALPASISLAHGLCAAADGRLPAPWGLDGEGPWA
jgi:hypothetical protein